MIYNERTLSRRIGHKINSLLGENFIQWKVHFFSYFRKKEIVKEMKCAGPVFRNIEIETINICNGKCRFCPVSTISPHKREIKVMEKEVFEKIIRDLSNMNYQGSIGLYSNNEPYIDQNILSKMEYVRSFFPNNILYLYTNGSLLDYEKVKISLKYLDRLVIDDYGRKNTSKKIQDIYEKLSESEKNKVDVYLRMEDELLNNRAGFAMNRSKMKKSLDAACACPFEQMVVRSDGHVSRCCNDALGKIDMGDVRKNTLLEIWESDEYKSVREKMLSGDRESIELCKDCDSMILHICEF